MAKDTPDTKDSEAPVEEADGTIIDKLLDLFQSNEAAIEYGTDPQGWVDENLPEGAEAADVAQAMPEVCGRLGGPYEANAARYNATHGAAAHPATASVVNEISYTYNTVYQQNAFIYAEEGAQVVNIQGDGNTVNQNQIDLDFDVNAEEYPEDDYEDPKDHEDDYEDPMDPHEELPEDTEDHEDDREEWEDEDPTEPEGEEPWGEDQDPADDGWEDPGDAPVDPPADPAGDPAGDPTGEPDVPVGAEAL